MTNFLKQTPKAYLFRSIIVKQGPHQSPKYMHGDEASVMFDSKDIYINRSKWHIKGRDIEKMDGLERDRLVISTTKGKTYEFQQFMGDEDSWQDFRKRLEKVYARKTVVPKDSFSTFIKGSSKLGLGSPHRVRLAPGKVVTDKKTPPRRTHGVFGRARQRSFVPSVPWDNEETVTLSDEKPYNAQQHETAPPSPKNSPVESSDDELEEERIKRVSLRKRRLVIDDESSDDEDIGSGLPMTTPQANRVVSPRFSARSLSPKRQSEELDKNQTTLAGFFKLEQNPAKFQMSPVNNETILTPKKSTVKLLSTPTRLGTSTSGSNRKQSMQQKGWLSPSNNKSRGRTLERFGILNTEDNNTDALTPISQSNSRSCSSTYGNSHATFVFHEDISRDEIEEEETSGTSPTNLPSFSSTASPTHSPVRRRLAFQGTARSPVHDLSKTQTDADLRFNRFSGLRNLGNTCYMNSCLQMICTLSNLVKALNNSGGVLTHSLTDVAEKLQKDSLGAVDPRAVKTAMDSKTKKFLGYEQRDAHEFLSDLIDFIHEEVQAHPKIVDEGEATNVSSNKFSDATSPMDSFLLKVHVCLTCSSCGYSRSKEETYRHLSVDIISSEEGSAVSKATVEKGLIKFFAPEIREIKCEKCADGTHATQTIHMVQRPKALLLHLKRFIFVEQPLLPVSTNDENKSPNSPSKSTEPVQMQYVFQKNKEQVQLCESLSLDAFLLKPTQEGDSLPFTESRKEYKLKSIVHHIGSRASSGHYTADALRLVKTNSNDDKEGAEVERTLSAGNDDVSYNWVTFDDTTSYVTSLDKILSNQNKERTAYMLLYSLDEL